MIYGSDVAAYDAGENTCLSYINGNQTLQTGMIISQKTVNSQQPHHAKIAQHLQNIASTIVIIAISSSELFKAFFLLFQDLNDHGFLHERLQVIEHTIDIPCLQVTREIVW